MGPAVANPAAGPVPPNGRLATAADNGAARAAVSPSEPIGRVGGDDLWRGVTCAATTTRSRSRSSRAGGRGRSTASSAPSTRWLRAVSTADAASSAMVWRPAGASSAAPIAPSTRARRGPMPRGGADKAREQVGAASSFLSDIREIRRRARLHLEQGPVTEGYRADRGTVIRLLNEALATEIVCVLRYKRHYYMATGIHAQAVAQEFLEHAGDEQGHADRIAERITQLGGEPDFNPESLTTRSHSEYVPGHDLLEMIREDLVAERIAVESYAEMIRYIGPG